jgi:hypothetical protein
MERSYEGILSNDLPDFKRAIIKSDELGKMMDDSIYTTIINNLDTYFKFWL